MGGFEIRSRKRNRPVRFHLNPSQKKIIQMCIEHCDEGKRMYVIFLKARRLGVTTFVRALANCHLLYKEHASAIIMAQLKTVASSIFQESVKLAKQVPLPKSSIKTTQQLLQFTSVPSELTWNTANSVVGTRGLAYTNLHATEAAYYENSEVFTAALSTLSDDPDNMSFIETTANGKEGPGKAYHDWWQAAVAGDNEYLPIFLPWWEDPEYVRPATEAMDAPRDDYERYLMKELHLSRERIAFYRYTLANKCSNQLSRWRKEYPGTPEEAFESTGAPVFDFDDTSKSRKGCREPKARMELLARRDRNGLRVVIETPKDARFCLYEKPHPKAHYFMGVVRGVPTDPEEDNTESLAMVVWNGETGRQAARFVDRLNPANATDLVCALATLFNRAMVNVDQGNGGYGTHIIQELRDKWRYNNQYRWKGRNDKTTMEMGGKTLGFSVSEFTRNMTLNSFITSLKRGEVSPADEMFVDQMSAVQWEDYYPYEPEAGESDVFWAGMLGWIARTQHHPRRCEDFLPFVDLEEYDDAIQTVPHQKSPFSTPLMYEGELEDGGLGGMTLQHHLNARDRKETEYGA